MRLPEPARTLLLSGWPRLSRVVSSIGIRSDALQLGGGTVLAARWGHRKSFDLDFHARPGTALHRLHEQLHRTALPRDGWDLLFNARIEKLLLVAPSPEHGTDERGRIEIWNQMPTPEHGAAPISLDGHDMIVLSTTQILCGKMRRAVYCIPRDVLDFATAARHDPASLEEAVNHWNTEAARNVAGMWRKAAGGWTDDDLNQIRAVAPGALDAPRDMADAAAAAVEAAVYSRIEVRKIDDENIAVQTVSVGGAERTRTFQLHGMTRELNAKGFTHRIGNDRAAVMTQDTRKARAGELLYAEDAGRGATPAVKP